MSTSPYAALLGAAREQLHPTLARYFDTIPDGHVGVGTGAFDVVGTPRRWLHPVLRLLERRGVVPAGYRTHVPFTVVNRTVGDTARGQRTLHFPSGDWTMTDRASMVPGGIVDTLGTPPTVVARFELTVADGGLTMRSTRAGLRLGRLRVTAPPWFTPDIRIRESTTTDGRQHVAMTLDLPLLGRVYEYRGSFDYEIREDS